MKNNTYTFRSNTLLVPAVLLMILVITSSSNCGGGDIKINYQYGTFPDSIINIEGMNTEYDDYNMALPQISLDLPIIFSSNRNSNGEEFDFVTGLIFFVFNQFDGSFDFGSQMYATPYFDFIEESTNSAGNEFGPMRFFNGYDGYEYFFYATDNGSDNLDLKYIKYIPTGGINYPVENYTGEITALNSSANDAYITLDPYVEKAYITSDPGGDYNIYEADVNQGSSLSSWLSGDPVSLTSISAINSEYDDKCPYIFDTLMVFTSDRPGGLGGFDLYYSTYSEGTWSSPVNFGPGINTEYNEYRPLMGMWPGFTNSFLLFSSDRPGGLGGFDLYFTGLDIGAE